MLLVCISQVAATPLADPPTVTEVRFEGLNSVSSAYANSLVRTSEGAALDQGLVAADVARLLTSGKFASVEDRVTTSDAGAVVTFVVTERPQITDVRFTGNRKFSDDKLSKQVPLQVGDAIDTFRVRDGQEAILQLYRDAGYGEATVTHDDQLLRSTGELLYVVEEGPHVRIRKILFEGLENIEEGELKKRMSSKTYAWIFRDGKFDEDAVDADSATIQNYIREQGYLDARVGYSLDFSADREDLTITFTIVEGVRYVVQAITFDGNTVFSADELITDLPLDVDAPFIQDKLEKSQRQIVDKYGSAGYIYALVRPVRVFSETPGFVRITFDIEEGSKFDVGRIVIRGNSRTQDKVIRRELSVYPGEVFDMPAARESETRLQQTRLFGGASVSPVGDEEGVRDVLVTIDEGKKAGDFIFGFGVTSNSGLVGSIVLDLRNFDLFDTPRTFAEFIKLRSFYGAGQRLRIEAQPGTDLNRFRIDFTEPYLFDKPTRFDFSAYFFERGRETWDERRIGTTVSFGRRLKWEPLEDWYGEVAFRVEGVRVDNLEVFAPRDVRRDEGSDLLTSVKGSLIRDRTDSRFLPTTGDRLRVAYEQFGVMGGEFFGKVSGDYTRHFTLATDEFERKKVLSLKGVAGYVVGNAPVYERYYAGGIGSIRGFDFRGVSPRQGLDPDNQVGGEFMLLFSSEYSFPLYGKVLRGLVFTDMGTVEENVEIRDWRVSVGGGVRVQVDFFGPIPLEFDVAVPVIDNRDDDRQIFSFFIGATF
ncbi:MAG: outer membrane protein assembly factor [Phycisphaerales bacterium]|nr:outer membrane protein assembly factor [Phycisphaerales bacterium]